MAGESKNDVGESVTSTDTEIKKTKEKKGLLSRLWGTLFRVRGDDFEKRLEHISKEEAAILARIRRRSHSWRRITRHFIIFSVLFEVLNNRDMSYYHMIHSILEVIAVGYAIMTTRSLHMNWKMRALRVLPMFLLPALCFITYSAIRSLTRMRDSKDHKTLDNLRAERQAKINELKEKTNYYITQQLIQRYDTDPAAKAAAATVLASKLGADSGLKLYVADNSDANAPIGRSNDVEIATTSGLRSRKQPLLKTGSAEIASVHHTEEGMLSQGGFEGLDVSQQNQLVVEHHPQAGLSSNDGGWIARLAALLVGEDPTQSYALICGNCHMHNGLARKEDFPYVTYYCPRCNALNRPKQANAGVSGLNSPTMHPSSTLEDANVVSSSGDSTVDKLSSSSSPLAAATAATATGESSPSSVG